MFQRNLLLKKNSFLLKSSSSLSLSSSLSSSLYIKRNFSSSFNFFNSLNNNNSNEKIFSEEIEIALSRNPREALNLIEKGCLTGKLQLNENQFKTYFKIANRYNLIDKIDVSSIVKAYIGSNNNLINSSGGGISGGTPSHPIHVNVMRPSLWYNIRGLIINLFGLFLGGVILLSLLDDKSVPGPLGGRVTGSAVHRAESSDKRFDDVIGADEAKEELKEIVQYLKDPKKFTRLGGKLPKGVLLTGPPGTGKTLLAKAIAGEAGVRFLYSSGSEFEEMFVGVGAKRVRELFQQANEESPCIIFIDEIDAIGGVRQLKDQSSMKMTLNQLLVEMDGFKENSGIIVIGATNFAESLDPALTRPGRIDKHVTVSLPDVGGRKAILEHYGKKVPISNDVDFEQLARGTPGFSGAELANLVNEAAIRGAVKNLTKIDMATFEYAKDKIMMGSERQSAVISKETMKVTAYHEAGHALLSLLTDGADPIHKATIMPRGRALGMVMQLPDGDQTSYSKKQMLAKLDICMGGRIAEEMIFGEENVTSGATGDFQQATRLAHAMITKWGFSTKLGIQFLDDKDKLSGETQNIVDNEIRKLLDDSYARAKTLLQTHQKELKLIAEALMEHETLSGAEIADIYHGRPLNLRVRTQKASRELSPMPESKKKSKLTPSTVVPNNNASISHNNTSTPSTPSTIPEKTNSTTTIPEKTTSVSATTSTSSQSTSTSSSTTTNLPSQQTQTQTEKNNSNQNKVPIRGPPVTPK